MMIFISVLGVPAASNEEEESAPMDMDSKAQSKRKASRHVDKLFKEELQGSESEVNPEKSGDFEFQLEQEELKVVPPNHSV